jgi:hypothetical protein
MFSYLRPVLSNRPRTMSSLLFGNLRFSSVWISADNSTTRPRVHLRTDCRLAISQVWSQTGWPLCKLQSQLIRGEGGFRESDRSFLRARRLKPQSEDLFFELARAVATLSRSFKEAATSRIRVFQRFLYSRSNSFSICHWLRPILPAV